MGACRGASHARARARGRVSAAAQFRSCSRGCGLGSAVASSSTSARASARTSARAAVSLSAGRVWPAGRRALRARSAGAHARRARGAQRGRAAQAGGRKSGCGRGRGFGSKRERYWQRDCDPIAADCFDSGDNSSAGCRRASCVGGASCVPAAARSAAARGGAGARRRTSRGVRGRGARRRAGRGRCCRASCDATAALVMRSARKSSAVHALDRKLKLVVAPGGAARAFLLALGVPHVYARAEKRRRARGPRQACCAAGARRVVGRAGTSPAESRLGGAPPRRPQRRAREAPGLGAQL